MNGAGICAAVGWHFDLIGNALALAISDRLFLSLEPKCELLFHVAGGGPAHQRFDRPGLLGLIVLVLRHS